MKRIFFLALLSVEASLLKIPLIADACAVCVTGANDPTADAFNASVLFLMSTPYLVVGSIAGALFFIYRRKAAKREQGESEQTVIQLAWDQEDSGR